MGEVGSAFHRVAETYHAHPHTGTAGMSVYLRSAAFGSKVAQCVQEESTENTVRRWAKSCAFGTLIM